MNCVKCNSQGGFLCKCGTRYCSRACQKAHWKIHKPICIAASIGFKASLVQALKDIINAWDEMKCDSFTHYSAAEMADDGIRAATGPYGGMVCFASEVWAALMNGQRKRDETVLCRTWLLVLSDGCRKNMTTIMINVPGTRVDRILSVFAPEHAMPGWAALHFFDYDTAISVMSPLMCVD